MKYIKLFEDYNSDDDVNFDEKAPKYLTSIEQESVKVRNNIFNKFIETEDFIYFTLESDDDVLMYRKSDLSLASDNYFAQNDLFGVLLDKNYIWASEDALYTIAQMENDGSYDDI